MSRVTAGLVTVDVIERRGLISVVRYHDVLYLVNTLDLVDIGMDTILIHYRKLASENVLKTLY